jgi:hypothetical protein
LRLTSDDPSFSRFSNGCFLTAPADHLSSFAQANTSDASWTNPLVFEE